MRAVRFHGREDIRIDEVEEPICGNGQVKVREYTRKDKLQLRLVLYVAWQSLRSLTTSLAAKDPTCICGHMWKWGKLPTTLGHEFSGTIEEIGTGVTGLKVGDRVAVKPNLSDGTCSRCSIGRFNSCENLGFIGYSGKAGGLSDHVVVDTKHAIPLPDSIPLDIGALVEPLSVAWHAVSRSPLQEHDTVLVVGTGPIGLAIIQVLRAKGISNIIAVEVSEKRREFALTLGATEVLNPLEVDAVARAGLDTAMKGLRVRGTTVIVSLWEHKPVIDAFAIVLDEKHVTGAAVFDDGDFEAVIDAIASGKIQPRPMITSKIPMEDVTEKGFKALIGERDKHVKILVDISA
ncbi:hypothetical protein N7522_010702 [Penicillium canescens]|nr:hypothetical protein N7522_010702 [Penicillium canescens]